jgi:ubiquinone/menaquinone biosynthesis C-methylase UbiE
MSERVFNPSEAHRLDDPERLTWLPPDEIISRLELRSGMWVADIGAGTGYFAIPMARAVQPGGFVYAVDFQPEMLAKLKENIAASGEKNVRAMQGSATNTNLYSTSCHIVLMANVWHELDSHPSALFEAERIIRPAGRLAILDWRPDVERPPGPPIEHRLSSEQVSAVLKAHAWTVISMENIGPYSYLLQAARSSDLGF